MGEPQVVALAAGQPPGQRICLLLDLGAAGGVGAGADRGCAAQQVRLAVKERRVQGGLAVGQGSLHGVLEGQQRIGGLASPLGIGRRALWAAPASSRSTWALHRA